MLNPTRDLLLFAATAPTATESNAVTRSWATAYIKARRADAIRQLRASNLALERRVRALHQQFRAVDAELKRLDPTYYSKLGYGGPYGVPFGVRDPAGPTQVRKHATVHELNLWNERIRFLRQLADAGAEAARSHIVGSSPNVVSTVVAQSPAVRVSETAPAAVLVLLSWAIGLAVALVGAIILYRRRTGAMSQVSV
jgi:hypothetical protein